MPPKASDGGASNGNADSQAGDTANDEKKIVTLPMAMMMIAVLVLLNLQSPHCRFRPLVDANDVDQESHTPPMRIESLWLVLSCQVLACTCHALSWHDFLSHDSDREK